MRLKQPSRREPPENTIPLINVVFLMLIFFLFAGSVSRDDARKIQPPMNILEDETIRSTGALIIDDEGKTHFADGVASIDAWLAQQDNTSESGGPIKIAADGTLKADVLEKILAEFKAAGRTDIVLITRRSPQ
ncbi:MAG: biopolymer transporter ExbD [Hyphomicrobiales bacterium]